MPDRRRLQALRRAAVLAMVCALVASSGCFNSGRRDDRRIRITGSDTMVNLAQAWAEAYQVNHPDISTTVKGGGTGVGIAALINGKVDIAPASRAMTPKELEMAKERTGQEPREFIVGRDALAIYVHKNNPLDAITIPDLAEIYGERGKIQRWADLDIENTACAGGEIIRISRQNNSGTYVYFKEAVLGKEREYKQGTLAQNGSSDLVVLVSNTPCAMGYSGMGYNQPGVKMLKIAKKKGEPEITPTIETVLDDTYPIARPLYLYTLGEPTGAVQEFIQWAMGPEGQKIVADVGYVPNATQPTEKPSPTPTATPESAPSESPASP